MNRPMAGSDITALEGMPIRIELIYTTTWHCHPQPAGFDPDGVGCVRAAGHHGHTQAKIGLPFASKENAYKVRTFLKGLGSND